MGFNFIIATLKSIQLMAEEIKLLSLFGISLLFGFFFLCFGFLCVSFLWGLRFWTILMLIISRLLFNFWSVLNFLRLRWFLRSWLLWKLRFNGFYAFLTLLWFFYSKTWRLKDNYYPLRLSMKFDSFFSIYLGGSSYFLAVAFLFFSLNYCFSSWFDRLELL